jgi:archaeosine-15-forming tRNA-guanine transglycosylase
MEEVLSAIQEVGFDRDEIAEYIRTGETVVNKFIYEKDKDQKGNESIK